MMRIILFSLLAFSSVFTTKGQTLTLLHDYVFPGDYHASGDTTGGSDCWGWTSPDGIDYAIFGTLFGTHYVRASDGVVLDSVLGAQNQDYYYHRDIKTYRNYAYVVGEMTGPNAGVQIVDLSYLPDSVHLANEYTFGTWVGSPRSHNLSIDTATAHAYVMAPDYTGVRIISLADPENLVDVGFVPTGDIHDAYARNDTVWCADSYNQSFSIWNVTDKTNPVQIGLLADPNFGYCHAIWPSPNGRYFATCEETGGKTVKIWDAANFSNITLASEYTAPCSLVHNAHWMGDSIYFSYYESGFVVIDVTNPANPIEVASYDTYPGGDTAEFYGCWGAFPFSKNGYMYSSNIEGKMQIYRWDTVVVAIQDESKLASQNAWPNPFVNRISLSFEGQFDSNFIEIISLEGRKVASLKGRKNGKFLIADWNAEGQHSGLYFAIPSGNTKQGILIQKQ